MILRWQWWAFNCAFYARSKTLYHSAAQTAVFLMELPFCFFFSKKGFREARLRILKGVMMVDWDASR